MSEALYRKYRPTTFGDVTDQEHVKTPIKYQLETGTVAHAYLFSGPRGVGKTTIARLLAKALNCQNRKEGTAEPCNTCDSCAEMNTGRSVDIIEIDAASNTGVDNVRENIIENIRFAPNKSTYKVFIIDEVHMLSTAAFNALLKTLEEPPSHAVFILATTELHKVPETIISRCQRYDFRRIAKADMIARLKEITKGESVQVDDAVLAQIVRLSEGCLRDAESLLTQVLSVGGTSIRVEEASIVLPVTHTETLLTLVDNVSKGLTKEILEELHTFTDQGGSVKHLSAEIVSLTRDMLFVKLGSTPSDAFAGFEDRVHEIVGRFSTAQLTELLDALLASTSRGFYDPLPQLPLEIALVGFCEKNAGGSIPATVTEEKEQMPQPVSMPERTEQKTAVNPSSTEPDSRPEEAPEIPESRAEDDSSGAAAEPVEVKDIDITNLTEKWGRVTEALAKQNIALPLVMGTAKPLRVEGKALYVGFSHKFHFDTINSQKNLAMLSKAVNEVMQSDIMVSVEYIQPEDEKTLDTLVEAFGGSVMD